MCRDPIHEDNWPPIRLLGWNRSHGIKVPISGSTYLPERSQDVDCRFGDQHVRGGKLRIPFRKDTQVFDEFIQLWKILRQPSADSRDASLFQLASRGGGNVMKVVKFVQNVVLVADPRSANSRHLLVLARRQLHVR